MRLALVTNLCTHYTVGTFEALARMADVDFLFHSRGQEWYHGAVIKPLSGDFRHEYLPAIELPFGLRATPALFERLARGRYDAIIMSIDGRVLVPLTLAYARTLGTKFVLWTGLWSDAVARLQWLTAPLRQRVYERADAVATYGDHVKRYLVSKGIAAEKIFPAYHAMNNEAFRTPLRDIDQARWRAELGLAPGPLVLFVGRLQSEKGAEVLLDAVARLGESKPQLLLVGAGPLEGALRERARGLGVQAVFCTRSIPNREMPCVYALADVLAVPSVTTKAIREPWGFVVPEAMNQAVPVIASTAVGSAASDLIRHEREGLIVPEGDPAALAGAIRRLLADPVERRRLGDAGAQRVLEFSQQRSASVLLEAARYALEAGVRSARG